MSLVASNASRSQSVELMTAKFLEQVRDFVFSNVSSIIEMSKTKSTEAITSELMKSSHHPKARAAPDDKGASLMSFDDWKSTHYDSSTASTPKVCAHSPFSGKYKGTVCAAPAVGDTSGTPDTYLCKKHSASQNKGIKLLLKGKGAKQEKAQVVVGVNAVSIPKTSTSLDHSSVPSALKKREIGGFPLKESDVDGYFFFQEGKYKDVLVELRKGEYFAVGVADNDIDADTDIDREFIEGLTKITPTDQYGLWLSKNNVKY